MKKAKGFKVLAKKGKRAEIRCECGKLIMSAKKEISIDGR